MEQRFLEQQLKELEKISKAETTAVSGKIDIAEITEKNKLGQLTNAARQAAPGAARMASLMGLDQEGDDQDQEYSDVAQNLNPNLPRLSYRKNMGPFTVSMGGGRKASSVVPVTDKILGALQSGGVIKEGKLEPFEDKKTAEAYANQNLGIGWEKKYPKARNMIDLNFGKIEDVLPAGTTKTSEAMKYLMEQRGLSQPQAAQWLRTKQQDKIKVK